MNFILFIPILRFFISIWQFFCQIVMKFCRSFAKILENDKDCQHFAGNCRILPKIVEISGIPATIHSVRMNNSILSLIAILAGERRTRAARRRTNRRVPCLVIQPRNFAWRLGLAYTHSHKCLFLHD